MTAQIAQIETNAVTAAPFKKIDKRALVSMAVVGLAVAVDVTAGSDSTFTEIVTSLDGWMTGSLGKVFALFMNMDKLVGGDFERGLAALAATVAARKS